MDTKRGDKKTSQAPQWSARAKQIRYQKMKERCRAYEQY